MIHISVPFTSLCQRIARCLPQARCLCSDNIAIDFKTSIEAYFVEKTAIGCRSCSRLVNYAITLNKVLKKKKENQQYLEWFLYCDKSVGISLLSFECVRRHIRVNTHTYIHTYTRDDYSNPRFVHVCRALIMHLKLTIRTPRATIIYGYKF